MIGDYHISRCRARQGCHLYARSRLALYELLAPPPHLPRLPPPPRQYAPVANSLTMPPMAVKLPATDMRDT